MKEYIAAAILNWRSVGVGEGFESLSLFELSDPSLLIGTGDTGRRSGEVSS